MWSWSGDIFDKGISKRELFVIPAVCHRISTLFVSMMRRLGCRYCASHGISHQGFLVENMVLSCLSMNFLQKMSLFSVTTKLCPALSIEFAVLFAQSSKMCKGTRSNSARFSQDSLPVTECRGRFMSFKFHMKQSCTLVPRTVK